MNFDSAIVSVVIQIAPQLISQRPFAFEEETQASKNAASFLLAVALKTSTSQAINTDGGEPTALDGACE